MNTLKHDLGKSLYEINATAIRESAELRRKSFEKYLAAQCAILQRAQVLVRSAFDCAYP